MRHLVLLPAMSVFSLLVNSNFFEIDHTFLQQTTDTGIIIHHKQDGIINEWPSSKFETDISTDISYAIDNDSTNLYLALNIPNQGIQMKLMRTGMNLYIDLKGKKKEGRGISFPVKDENVASDKTSFVNAAGTEDANATNDVLQPQRQTDIKAARSAMALRLTYMSVFGFEGIENHDQGLQMPGSINISFAWDSADVMHIEYAVPLKMLEDAAALKNKEIAVGWKINGVYPSDKPAGRKPRNRANAGYGEHHTGFDPNAKRINHETIIREQNIWTKYTMINL
jgi:hypothetical protein